MSEWKPAIDAPKHVPLLVCARGVVDAVGMKDNHGRWWVANSYGLNEDGEIYGVTHYMILPEPPEVNHV